MQFEQYSRVQGIINMSEHLQKLCAFGSWSEHLKQPAVLDDEFKSSFKETESRWRETIQISYLIFMSLEDIFTAH